MYKVCECEIVKRKIINNKMDLFSFPMSRSLQINPNLPVSVEALPTKTPRKNNVAELKESQTKLKAEEGKKQLSLRRAAKYERLAMRMQEKYCILLQEHVALLKAKHCNEESMFMFSLQTLETCHNQFSEVAGAELPKVLPNIHSNATIAEFIRREGKDKLTAEQIQSAIVERIEHRDKEIKQIWLQEIKTRKYKQNDVDTILEQSQLLLFEWEQNISSSKRLLSISTTTEDVKNRLLGAVQLSDTEIICLRVLIKMLESQQLMVIQE